MSCRMFHMKQPMSEYFVILKILSSVLEGKNLGEVFAVITKESTSINTSKVKDVCFGVMRNYNILQAIINQLVNNNSQDKITQIFLLIGIYEVKYTKKPEHAVVNELVNLVMIKTQDGNLKNFINAVLRNYLRNHESIKQAITHNLAFKHNCPNWLIAKLKKEYPNKYLDIIQYSNMVPKMSLRVNLNKITQNEYLSILKDNFIKFNLIDNKIVLELALKVEQIPFFKDGYVSIQDISAQKLLDLIVFKSGDYVLDACIAPGGKACHILENYQVKLLGLDISQPRLDKVAQNLNRLSLKADLLHANAMNLDWWDGRLFDIIIADVPCSASGTLKRNPDIKLHRKPSDLANFVLTQQKIVLNLWNTLKHGGKLVYITCSIFKEENHDNIEVFKKKLHYIKVLKELNILPTEYADGFYYCILEKV